MNTGETRSVGGRLKVELSSTPVTTLGVILQEISARSVDFMELKTNLDLVCK